MLDPALSCSQLLLAALKKLYIRASFASRSPRGCITMLGNLAGSSAVREAICLVHAQCVPRTQDVR